MPNYNNTSGIKPCLVVTKSSCVANHQFESEGAYCTSTSEYTSNNIDRMRSILKHSRARSFDSALTNCPEKEIAAKFTAYISKKIKESKGDEMNKNICGQRWNKNSVTLVVDESRFVINPEIFVAYPDTMLGGMFSPAWSTNSTGKSEHNEEIEISGNITSAIFRIILDFYKSGSVTCPPDISVSEIREAFDYFLIPFNANTVKVQDLGSLLHELTNVGARKRFEIFLENEILPVLVQCAQKGDRECYIVFLCIDDDIEWDSEYPPQIGDQYSGVLRNSHIHRFFKYVENRDVAKDVLKERGFKKIKLGIEGYPTHIDKIKRRAAGRAEVIYNYIQRSFLRMSWEKEEAKSRHVDFQCIRSKSGNTSVELPT
ncbi:hypothetical protein GJ496_010901, partial [Pomphorhynchus laevis]